MWVDLKNVGGNYPGSVHEENREGHSFEYWLLPEQIFDPLAQGLILIEQWRINCKRTWTLTSQLLGIYTLGPLAIRIVMYWG